MLWRMSAVLWSAVLLSFPAAAGTRVVSASGIQTGSGAELRAMTGIPRALTRNDGTVVGDGALATDTLYVFPERQGVTLAAPLNAGTRVVPAGTRVDSVYVCVDTEGFEPGRGPRGGTDYSARIRFDNPVLLATILRPAPLRSSAEVLGLPGITYASSRYVGVDPFWMGQDGQWYDGRDFLMRGNANGIDCMRLVFRAK
jgi:hypothetical protein